MTKGSGGADDERKAAESTSKVVPLRPNSRRQSAAAVRKDDRRQKAEGQTLCRRGFHRWQIDQTRRFDVKSGRLVTRRVCERCGEEKVTAD